MKRPAISVLIYTARTDHPFPRFPELHCFEPVTQTLAAQTFKDFELIVADGLWEERGDWFKEHPQPFPVKHIPSTPNYWHERGRPGLCAQQNRAIAWADGELIWVGAESDLFPPHFMGLAWSLFELGQIPVAWYCICDRATGDAPDHENPLYQYPKIEFDMLGHTPESIFSVDHRAQRFVDNPQMVVSPCHHQNYFAYSAIPTELALDLNGFDETFDGQATLLDTDLGSRIELAGSGGRLVMHRDLWLVEAWAPAHKWGGRIQNRKALKCSWALWVYNRLTRRRVNTTLPTDFIADVQQRVCRESCHAREKCAGGQIGESPMYPFCEGENKPLVAEYFAAYQPHELRADVELRKRGVPPFDRAHHWPGRQ